MNGPEAMEKARRLVTTLLDGTPSPTQDQIGSTVGVAVQMLQLQFGTMDIDEARLTREVESMYDVWVPSATSLEDTRGHREWLADRRADIAWNFWERYRRYLLDDGMPPESVDRLHEVTDEILKRLEDPGRPGEWDRRGMVVGQVQSGKTANYAGLICKAADAGYRLIIVLAGSHNSLRSQTQLRLDHGFLGFDTQKRMLFDKTNARLGVGLPPNTFFAAHSLTSSAENGDFKAAVANRAGVSIGGNDPVLLVVKKNASILKNLIPWATSVLQQRNPETGLDVVRGVPLLVIDDEADNASINTRQVPRDENGKADEDHSPTRINGRIRELLRSFEQSAYVGYTATPFANIFIPPDVEAKGLGEDLFPRSFIINLPAASNYMGPAQVFGLEADYSGDSGRREGLPIIRTVDDQEDWIPDRHRNGHVPGPMPASLKRAIRSFLLVCAARAVRGQEQEHNSMLIHVTRFTSVQHVVTEQVKRELEDLKRRLRYGDGNSPEQLREELREIWEADFVDTSERISEPGLSPVPWRAVERALTKASAKVEVLEINGAARDALQYFEHPNGFSCIAIGGDKLSRGLTLEGLSVSYYLRASRMYDTLMQMGRWFGYRPGYADLCRLYTTSELQGWYRDITAASEELRHEFDRMAAVNGTPEEFGLLVRKHPGTLMVTAAAKMRDGIPVQLNYSGTSSETVVFDRDPGVLARNYGCAEVLIGSLGEPPDTGSGMGARWRVEGADDVLTFLDTFVTHPDARKARTPLLASYIRNRVADSELTEWTVVLASGRGAAVSIGGQEVRLVRRTPLDEDGMHDPYQIKRIVSPADEALDLSPDESEAALALTRKVWEKDRGRSRRTKPPDIPGGLAIRRTRPARRGLLLLYPLEPEAAGIEGVPAVMGFAISFPSSDRASEIQYVVNNTYWRQEFALE